MAALKVRSMLTLRRAGCVCEAKLGATLPIRALQRGDVELAHLQQRFHHLSGVPGLRVAHHLAQGRGDALSGDTQQTLTPAARAFLAAIGEARPGLIELVLRLTGRDEREGLGERKGWA